MANEVTVTGNLARDPELRFTQAGKPTATFGLAVNRRWKGRDGDWQESVSFLDVVCWGDMAENVAESLVRGTRVIVTGRMEQRSWETEGRERRSKVEIVADEVAPSLRWSTADVTKTDRRATTTREPQPAARPEGFDEEPF